MNNTYKKYYGKKNLSQEEQYQRYQLMKNLQAYLPFLAHLQQLADVVKYPNKLLQDLYFQLTYVTENHFATNPELSQAYNQIYNLHQQSRENYFRHQKELYAYLQEHQMQEYAQQNYRPVDYNQSHNPHYGHGQKQYQQRHHQGQGQYQRNNDRKYQNRQGHRNNQQADRNGEHSHHQRGERPGEHGGYRKNFHQKGYNQTHYQKNFIQQDQETTAVIQPQIQVPKVEEVTKQPQVVVVPKPEPKPVRFSINQIKEFINSFSKEDLGKLAHPDVVKKQIEVNSWKHGEVEVEIKELPIRSQRGAFNESTVKKYGAKQPERMGYKPAEQQKLANKVEAIQDLEAGQIKQVIKNKAQDFSGQNLEKEKVLNKKKYRKKIACKLNLITAENLKDIEADLLKFLYHEEVVCKVIVEQIIKKVLDQPNNAGTYARLCAHFSQKPLADFKFEKKYRDNPFQTFLIESIQGSFDQTIKKFPIFESAQDKQLFLKQFKKKIFNNVKFIGELIICKVLSKRTIKQCISKLFQSFFKHYYLFIHDKKIEESVYHYQYEAIIQLIESLEENYDEMNEKEQDKQYKPKYSYTQIENHVQEILKTTQPPNSHILDCISSLSGEEYLQVLTFVNKTYMKKAFPKSGALLQNLIQKKNNKYGKKLYVTQVPIKVKQIQEFIKKQERKKRDKQKKIIKGKLEQEKLDKKVEQMYKGWEIGKNEEQKELKEILQKYNQYDLYLALLKQVADVKKEKVAKRVDLIIVVMNQPKFDVQEFKNAWIDAIKYLTNACGDFPFCQGALAKVLGHAIKRGGRLEQYHKKYEDEQQEIFSEQIIRKYYLNTQDENAFEIIKHKAKYYGLV